MNHEKIKDLLPLYIDNGLSEQEKKMIEEHLNDCEQCRRELKKYRENHNLLSAIEKEKAPADFKDTVLDKVNNTQKDKQSARKDNKILKKVCSFFRKPVRIPAGVIALVAVIILVSLTGLMGTFYNGGFPLNILQNREDALDYRSSTSNKLYESAPEISSTTETTSSNLTDSSAEQVKSQVQNFHLKLIRRANLVIELTDIEQIDVDIANLVGEYSGYISNSRNWYQNEREFYRLEIRVPAENFEQVLEQLSVKNFGDIISRTVSSQDVTEEYMDLEARLNNLNAQEERYRQLLKETGIIEEILKVESELTRIRIEIERLQGRKNYLDNRVNLSTITIEFRQPEPTSSKTPGFIIALRNAASKMVNHFYNIITLTASIIPYLLLIAIGYLVYRKITN